MATDTTEFNYRVDGMSCGHCKAAVRDEVQRVPGVQSADVDLDRGLVRVSGAGIDRQAVVVAIEQAGYQGVPA